MRTTTIVTSIALAAALSAGATTPIFATSARHVIATGKLGNGTVTLWQKGAQLGASIDDAALRSLPQQETRIDLPTTVTPFRLVEIDWHPHGHEPKGIYDVPHFDAHFYVIDKAERDAIAFGPPGSVAKPDPAIVPEGYVTDGTVVPMMGMHFAPASAPEFHGKPFMCTQIWGYNKGRLAFVEAMFSLKFINANASFHEPLAQPKHLVIDPLPRNVSVSRDNGGYSAVLTY
jgi:hypothetical protein